MKKIALVGYFGWGNFGDEMFVKTHIQQLSDDYELVIANDLTKKPYFSRPVKDIVKDVDAVLIGGGDLLNPINISPLYWNSAYLAKPTYIFGLGVPRQVKKVEHVLERYKTFLTHPNCKLVVARDQESYDWLAKNFPIEDKLRWFPDPVCSCELPAATPPEEKTLGIVMREHHSLDEDMDPLFELIARGRELGYKIKHIVLASMELGKGDYERALKIRGEHVDEEIVYTESLEEMCEAISSCSFLASIKFHGVIVATMYGIPSIAMSVTPKNKNFLKMIDASHRCHSYRSVGLADKLPEQPEPIDADIVERLRSGSLDGYALLRESLQSELEQSSSLRDTLTDVKHRITHADLTRPGGVRRFLRKVKHRIARR